MFTFVVSLIFGCFDIDCFASTRAWFCLLFCFGFLCVCYLCVGLLCVGLFCVDVLPPPRSGPLTKCIRSLEKFSAGLGEDDLFGWLVGWFWLVGWLVGSESG